MLACVFWKWLDGDVPSLAVQCHYCAVFIVTFASVWVERDVIIGCISTLNPIVLLRSRRVKKRDKIQSQAGSKLHGISFFTFYVVL